MGETASRMVLGESWDVVEVVRSVVTEFDALQKTVAAQEARVQVLEGVAALTAAPRPLVQVGDLTAESEIVRPGPDVSAGDVKSPLDVAAAHVVRPARAGKKGQG